MKAIFLIPSSDLLHVEDIVQPKELCRMELSIRNTKAKMSRQIFT